MNRTRLPILPLSLFLLSIFDPGYSAMAQSQTAVFPGLPMRSKFVSASFGRGRGPAPKQGFTTLSYPGSIYTVAYGINNSGDIVGTYVSGSGSQNGFVYSKGKYAKIVDPECNYLLAAGINVSREVVGVCGSQAFTYTSGGFSLLNYPGATVTLANGINTQGDVVGVYDDENGEQHGFLYSGGVFTDIDPPGATTTLAVGINSAGEIVGAFDGGGYNCGFTYLNGTYNNVNYPGALSQIFGINTQGDLAGNRTLSSGGAADFVYSTAGQKFLGFDLYNSTDSSADGINDNCAIVGYYTVGTTFYGYYVPRKSCPQ